MKGMRQPSVKDKRDDVYLTDSMEQNLFWETNSSAAGQEICRLLRNPV